MVRWGHAQRDHRRERRRPGSSGGGGGGSEQPAKARLAGADRAADRRRPRHGRDHAAGGHEQGRGLALAGAVHDRGGRRAAARQDPAVAHPAAGRRGGGAGGRADHDRRAAGRDARTGPPRRWRRRSASAPARCSGSGARTAAAAPGAQPSSSPTTRALPRSCAPSSGCMSTRRPMPSCSRSTRSRQIQALDRTQPGLPLKKGRLATMTHDY